MTMHWGRWRLPLAALVLMLSASLLIASPAARAQRPSGSTPRGPELVFLLATGAG